VRPLVLIRVLPGGPDDACFVGGGLALHHAVQCAGFDLFLEPDWVRVWREPVAEADAGEVAVREHDRDPLPWRLTCGDHFGAGDVAGKAIWLPWWQWVPGPGTVAYSLERHLVERGPPAMADDPAGREPRRDDSRYVNSPGKLNQSAA